MYFILALVVIELLLFGTNYQSGTYLVGWDNVMPEFNIWLNLKRSIFSIWQDYRGLGLLDGMSHGANLFHTLFIGVLSPFFPQSIVRYVFIHLTHLIGGISFFLLATSLTKKKMPSFLGALFYMFNIGVIQMYFAPLEVFATHFAALPLVALFTIRALHIPTRKNLALLFIIGLLTSPQGFVPTIFIVFGIFFFCLLFSHYFTTRKIKPIILVALAYLLSQTFWLLPYAYSALHTPEIIRNARINQFSSEEIYFRNKAWGDLISVLSLKGFMLDTIELDKSISENVYFLDVWHKHTKTIWYYFAYIPILCTALLGIFMAGKKKNHAFLPFVATFSIPLIFLANNTPLLEQFNNMFRVIFPLLGEAFRFPFTKLITLFAFSFSLLFTLGLTALPKNKKVTYSIATLGVICILTLSYPAFTGNFTSSFLRLPIPKDYLNAFSYFAAEDPTKRVALFPVHTFWNWQYTTWGHRGSGFIWHGIPQPLLTRAFDPWSQYNEQYYNEISYAVNAQNYELLNAVLQKYDIGYILLDTTIKNTTSPQPINYDSLIKFLGKNTQLSEEKRFGKIRIYSVKNTSTHISSLSQIPKSYFSTTTATSEDLLYKSYPNYIASSDTGTTSAIFPSLFTGKLQEDHAFTITQSGKRLEVAPKKLPPPTTNTTLTFASIWQSDFLIPITITVDKGTITLHSRYPRIIINDAEVPFTKETITLKAKTVTNPTKIILSDIKHTLDTKKPMHTYLLNKSINTLILQNGKQQEQIILDISQVLAKQHTIPMPYPIRSLRIMVDTLDTPFDVTRVIEDQIYKGQKDRNTTIEKEESFYQVYKEGDYVVLGARSAAADVSFYLDHLFHQGSYVLFADSTYISGLPMKFYVDNPLQNRPEVETVFGKNTYTNTVIIPHIEDYYKGYGFHFTVKSVGNELAESKLHAIRIHPLPHVFLQSIMINSNQPQSRPVQKDPVSFEKIHSGLYKAAVTGKEKVVVLSEAYDPAWSAYTMQKSKWQIVNGIRQQLPFLFGKKLTRHELINNWQNGWVLSETQPSQVVMVYIPSYLQYFGLLMTILAPLLLLIRPIFVDKR